MLQADDSKEEGKSKVKIRHIDLPIDVRGYGLSQKDLDHALEMEVRYSRHNNCKVTGRITKHPSRGLCPWCETVREDVISRKLRFVFVDERVSTKFLDFSAFVLIGLCRFLMFEIESKTHWSWVMQNPSTNWLLLKLRCVWIWQYTMCIVVENVALYL